MELNREEIIKALECCLVESNCTNCPLHHQYEIDCLKYAGVKALSLIKELTEESKKWEQVYDCMDSACRELSSKCDRLTEENERLKGHLDIEEAYKERLRGILLEFTDSVHKWGNKYGYDTSEISLVPILYEGTEITKQIKADTVRKMQERLKAEIEQTPNANEHFIKAWKEKIDQIAKEMIGE